MDKIDRRPENFKKPKPLTLRQKMAIAEYLKTGNKSAAYRSAYKTNPKNQGPLANKFFRNPKIVSALDKALKEAKFDDQYAVDNLKEIIEAGMKNKDIARPDTSLKALETYFKITNKMGGGNKVALKVDIESQAKKMDMSELQKSLKELDKKQKRILAIIRGVPEEGEVVK